VVWQVEAEDESLFPAITLGTHQVLWFGSTPPPRSRLSSLFNTVSPFLLLFSLVETGFRVVVEERRVVSRGIVITGSMDLPAKADAQYFVHHNGCSGCPFCLNPGKNVSTEHAKKKSTVHIYPCEGHFATRTMEGTLEDAEKALRQGEPVRNLAFCPLSFFLTSSFMFFSFFFFSFLR